jgi:hypothetical protein
VHSWPDDYVAALTGPYGPQPTKVEIVARPFGNKKRPLHGGTDADIAV